MSAPTPQPGILDIKPYVAGASSASSTPGTHVSRLASNESPLGPSPRAIEAYKQAADTLHRYPDGGASALRAALAERHGIDAQGIVCGNGSDELLALLAKCYAGPGDDVLFSEFGFLIYPIATRAAGATPVVAPEPDLRADIEAFARLAGANTHMVYLANPNNPTGSYITAPELRDLHGRLPYETLLVIDAAYAEYVMADDYDAGFTMVEDFDNVVITRTFSKLYGLAGLRLGWAYCPPAVADVLNRVRGPFNVTAPALAAGLAALGDVAHAEAAREHNARWLPWLATELRALGLVVHPSVANFILVEFPESSNGPEPSKGQGGAIAALAHLSSHGVIARDMGGYGLPDCLRIGIGTEQDMRAVVAACAEFLSLSEG